MTKGKFECILKKMCVGEKGKRIPNAMTYFECPPTGHIRVDFSNGAWPTAPNGDSSGTWHSCPAKENIFKLSRQQNSVQNDHHHR
jgi:hypothetical protein